MHRINFTTTISNQTGVNTDTFCALPDRACKIFKSAFWGNKVQNQSHFIFARLIWDACQSTALTSRKLMCEERIRPVYKPAAI